MDMNLTLKAESLPEELKVHFNNAMEEKFPLSGQEAMEYIRSHYSGLFNNINFDGSAIYIRYTLQKRVYAPNFSIASTNGTYQQNLGNFTTRFADKGLIIDNFTYSAIDEACKKFEKECNETLQQM